MPAFVLSTVIIALPASILEIISNKTFAAYTKIHKQTQTIAKPLKNPVSTQPPVHLNGIYMWKKLHNVK
jgi:hypothetical protein